MASLSHNNYNRGNGYDGGRGGFGGGGRGGGRIPYVSSSSNYRDSGPSLRSDRNGGGGYGGGRNGFDSGGRSGGFGDRRGGMMSGKPSSAMGGQAGAQLSRPDWNRVNLTPIQRGYYHETDRVRNRGSPEVQAFLRAENITIAGEDNLKPSE